MRRGDWQSDKSTNSIDIKNILEKHLLERASPLTFAGGDSRGE
jgi:hypothetical protein